MVNLIKLYPEHMEALHYSKEGHLVITPKEYNNVYDNWYYRNLCLPSDMVEHLVYLESIAKGKVVLELGTRTAVSTSAFSHSAAFVYTVDIDDCSAYIPEGIANVQVITGDSCGNYIIPTDVDIVLIDTEHTFIQVLKEFDHCLQFNPSLILFHDYQIEEVKQAIEHICAKYELEYSVIGNVYPIAIIKMEK